MAPYSHCSPPLLFIFSSFDNRECADDFLFCLCEKGQKWKTHMHTSRWQPAMTANYLRKEQFLTSLLKAFDIFCYFENQQAMIASNDNKALPYNIFYMGWHYWIDFLPLHSSHLPKASQQWINKHHTIISGMIRGHCWKHCSVMPIAFWIEKYWGIHASFHF